MKLLDGAEKVREGTIDVHSLEAKEILASCLEIDTHFPASKVKSISGHLCTLRKSHDKLKPKNPIEASPYLKDLLAPFWIEHGEEMKIFVFFDILILWRD